MEVSINSRILPYKPSIFGSSPFMETTICLHPVTFGFPGQEVCRRTRTPLWSTACAEFLPSSCTWNQERIVVHIEMANPPVQYMKLDTSMAKIIWNHSQIGSNFLDEYISPILFYTVSSDTSSSLLCLNPQPLLASTHCAILLWLKLKLPMSPLTLSTIFPVLVCDFPLLWSL